MDKIDVQILDILQREGRIQRNKIAEQVGLTIPAVSERMRKLEQKGIISGYHAKVNNSKIGKDVTAFVFVITTPSKNYNSFVDNTHKVSDIIECHSITGEGSHLLKIQTQNTMTLEKLLSDIQSWDGVLQTRTYIALSSYKEFSSLLPSEDLIK
ncbi:MAG: Lrp/AsnC family transcriptional regulator [Fidelibacterota bacterium]